MRVAHVFLALSFGLFAACSAHEKARDDDDPPARTTSKSSRAKADTSAASAASTSAASAPAPPADGVTLSVAKVDYTPGETVDVTFSRPLTPPPGQKYWITLTEPGDPEPTFGNWHYVADAASTDKLVPEGPGDWEVRLHDLYPQWKSGRIIARQRIHVEAAPKPDVPPAVAKQQPSPAPCTPGNPGACSCGDGRSGQRSCSASGHWGACDCASRQMPAGACEFNKTSACTCPGGAPGVTICNGQGWEPCAC